MASFPVLSCWSRADVARTSRAMRTAFLRPLAALKKPLQKSLGLHLPLCPYNLGYEAQGHPREPMLVSLLKSVSLLVSLPLSTVQSLLIYTLDGCATLSKQT